MKSSYPTYHNNKIEEQNKTTLFTDHTISWKNITHTHTHTNNDISKRNTNSKTTMMMTMM